MGLMAMLPTTVNVYGPMPHSGVSPRVMRIRSQLPDSEHALSSRAYRAMLDGLHGICGTYGGRIAPWIRQTGQYRVTIHQPGHEVWTTVWYVSPITRIVLRVR